MTNDLSSLELAVAQSDALSSVIPAQAGIQASVDIPDVDGLIDGHFNLDMLNTPFNNELAETHMDPGLHRDDESVGDNCRLNTWSGSLEGKSR